MRTLYRNARIHNPANPFATALLVAGDVIAWIGGEDAARQLSADATIDVADGLITPVFVDAHVHATSTGLSLIALDLSGAETLTQALDLIERQARAGRGRPILGGGWDEGQWPERRPPTAAELDRAGYGGSVYLARVDVHSALASSVLMASVSRLAELSGYRSDGWLTLEAHHAVRKAAYSTLSPGRIREAQRAMLRRAAALGIGCVHEMAGPEVSSADDLLALLELAGSEPQPEVVGYWGELLGGPTAIDLGAIGCGGDLFCDGSLGSHTAALNAPYADRPDARGELRFTLDEITAHFVQCGELGLQGGFHAIGDAALDQILNAVDLASARLGRPAGAGHRVEHAELLTDPARFAAAGLTASVQPAFDAAWGGPSGMYSARLGRERAGTMNRFAALAAAGIPLAFGSDAPVTPLDPWGTVRAAAYPNEPAAAISPRSAFAAHTRGGWRAGGRSGDGLIAVGAPASFAVWQAGELGVDSPDDRVSRWSTDPRSAVPGLPDLAPGVELPVCRRTVLRGRTIYDVEDDPGTG